MANTTARIKKGGQHFEVLVDLDEAMKVRKDETGASLSSAVLTESIFHNLKSGEQASHNELEVAFGTSDTMEVAEKIIKTGEVVRTTESIKQEHNAKYKQVVDFLSKNAVSPEGRPYTPDRIMKALTEAHVNVKNKPVESQVQEILDQLGKILPIKIETKKVKLIIPALHTGKAYATVKEFMIQEDWKNNGDLEVIVQMPTALIFDFYDKINGATHGSVMSEEMK
ncbi:ribosome assembly factor SBDS [Candidatus Pacearchaeota archaeon]|nr:ribosome assembly factor SBDS [Candidatus Pacearchaeota archaeon]